MNPNYDLPTTEQFEEEIFPARLQWYKKKINSKTFMGLITVFSKDIKDDIYFLALANTISGEYVFLRDEYIAKHEQA